MSERVSPKKRRIWKLASWIVYLIGVPAWVILFVQHHNWMAAAVETGGIPSMILGIVIVLKGKENTSSWLDHIAKVSALFGFGYSMYDIGWFTSSTQFAEMGVVIGFFAGVYLLANENYKGYAFFIFMNLSNGCLMYLQDFYGLVIQQVFSAVVMYDAYHIGKKNAHLSIKHLQ